MSLLSRLAKKAAELATEKGAKRAAEGAGKRVAEDAAEDLAVRRAESTVKPKPRKVAVKPKAVINFGLVIDADMPRGPGKVDPVKVKQAIRGLGRKVLHSEVKQSGTEPTLIATLDNPLTADEMVQLTALFDQKAMAHVDSTGKGVIEGQRKDLWGPYDPEYMLLPEGDAWPGKAPEAPAIIKRASGASKRTPSASSKADFAVRYPQVAPPVLQIDKRTGKEFLGKGKSAEAELAAKDMKRVTAEMEEGYTPYFNPEERFYADPGNYALEGDTLGIRPAKDATVAQYEARANDPAVRERLLAAYARGSEHPGAARWYATGQLEKAFTDALGPEAGRNAYKQRFADAMAATTGGMDPQSNLRLAHYMNYLTEHGMDTPSASYELPYPIGGGKYGVMPNIRQHDRFIRQGEGLSVANPKRFNFSGNFLGDVNRATLDEQMMSMWDPKLQMPPTNTYGVYEGALAKLAKELGVPPAEAQDVMWAGIKLPKEATYTPRPMIDIVNDSIERTSRLTGLDPDEVVEGIVTGKRPLYAKGGRVDEFAVKPRPPVRKKRKGGRVEAY